MLKSRRPHLLKQSKMLVALVLALATAAFATNATGPYVLHVTGKTNSSIDGYVGACHAGAAIEGLCYSDGDVNSSATYNQFYYNYSSYNPDTGEVYQPGFITWLLTFSGSDDGLDTEPEALVIEPNLSSNVQVALFYPGLDDATYINYYPDNGTLYIDGGPDDSSFNATYPSSTSSLGNLTNFHLCYQYTGGYYYHSIAWVSTQPPHNPSCQPVDLSLELIDDDSCDT
ncbi:hypothetical protein BJ170DRAFT_641838 [Xylariales sp. AK1849]|nr:hypothetical protein BJ170DRAFT_641838 [Xylariales sp. AK1849]